MCGFKGFAFWRKLNEFPPSHPRLSYQSVELIKRGPDERNTLVTFPLILDHYRLSIRGIDMRESSQPKENSSYVFAFNGEIYAHSFKSLHDEGYRSDTVFLWQKLNAEGPINFLRDVSGEFSIVVYDKKRNLLFLSVDYFGVKPLYYSLCDYGVSFSSTLKDCWKNISLVSGQSNLNPVVDNDQLGEYLLFRSFSGNATGYTGIDKILPGEIKVFDLTSEEQSSLALPYNKKIGLDRDVPNNIDDYSTYILSLLKMYAQSDVPISLCLSGGIDSTVALYALWKNHIFPTCFNVSQGFDDPDFKACQKILEDLPNLNCKFIDVINSNPWNPSSYQDVHDIFDGWVHLPNAVYLNRLFKQAASNFKVILSGEGADELLGSYNRYMILPQMLAKKYSDNGSSYQNFQHWPSESLGLANEIALTSSFSSRELGLVACRNMHLNNGLEGRADYLLSKTVNHNILTDPYEVSQMMQLNDIRNYLPSMLRRQDVLSMNYSIECRVPFASLEFMHLCKMSDEALGHKKLFGSKGIMKNIAESINVPRAITSRKKHGFPPERNSFDAFLSSDYVGEKLRTSNFCSSVLEVLPVSSLEKMKHDSNYNAYNDFKFSLLNIALLGV